MCEGGSRRGYPLRCIRDFVPRRLESTVSGKRLAGAEELSLRPGEVIQRITDDIVEPGFEMQMYAKCIAGFSHPAD